MNILDRWLYKTKKWNNIHWKIDKIYQTLYGKDIDIDYETHFGTNDESDFIYDRYKYVLTSTYFSLEQKYFKDVIEAIISRKKQITRR